jgi:DNA-binding NtrC family response regulator
MNKSVTGVSNEVMQILKNHTWRGHVRELENAVERAMIFCDGRQIRREHLSSVFQDGGLRDYPDELNAALRMFEARRVRLMLERCDQDKNAAAARLGISISSLYRKLASERGSS